MSQMMDQVRKQGLGILDLELGGLLARLSSGGAESGAELGLAAALASAWRRHNHTCLPLASIAGESLERVSSAGWGVRCPELKSWRQFLLASGLVRACASESCLADRGEGLGALPLVLDESDRLYLERFWEAERLVTRGILSRLSVTPETAVGLDKLGTLIPDADLDAGQRQAIVAACSRQLAVITGGPGTGKTTTLARVLAVVLEHDPTLRVRLVAPTGKAASRMQEAVERALKSLPPTLQERIRSVAPALTAHRLLHELGRRGDGALLDLDWLIVDEASMVDLPLMARMVAALPERAHLLLLGDPDQLASVEAGAVLAEVCEGLERRDCLSRDDSTVIMSPVTRLRRGHRFAKESLIGALAEAVRTGEVELALQILEKGGPGLCWIDPLSLTCSDELAAVLEAGYRGLRESATAEEALASLDRFRVIAAHRRGRLGVEGINAWCSARWRRIYSASPGAALTCTPIMVRANDPVLGLSNGDCGVRWVANPGPGDRDPQDGGPASCFFNHVDGVRSFHEAQLPELDEAWAMTVHQSQGSEMDSVLLLLPPASSPLLSRELLYTGLSRARVNLVLVGSREAVGLAVSRRFERSSGLGQKLAVAAL